MEFTRKRIKNTEEIDINLKIENNQATAIDYLAKGDISIQKNNSAQALVDYNKAIELQPTGMAYFRVAQIYHGKNHLQFAILNYDKAVLLDNSIQDIFYFRASVNLGLRNYERAIEDFTTAINLSPNDYNSFFYRAVTHENLGHKKNAIADYTNSINISAQNHEAYFNRAKLYLKLNQQQKAVEDFNNAIQLKPEIKKQSYKLLKDFDEQKKIQAIIKQKELQIRKQKQLELQRIEKNKVEYNQLMSSAKTQKSRKQNAIAFKTYTKALSLNKYSAEAYFRRGEILWDKGENSKALSDFNKASSIDERYSSMMLAIVGVDALKYAGELIGNLLKKKK